VQSKLGLKLQLYSLECNEVKLFTLLMLAAIDSIIEYTKESLTQKWMYVLTAQEFRKFLCALLLTSAFPCLLLEKS